MNNVIYRPKPQKALNFLTATLVISFCLVSIMPAVLIMNSTSGIYVTLGLTLGIADQVFFVILYGAFSYLIYTLFMKFYSWYICSKVVLLAIPFYEFLICFGFSYAIRNVVVAIFGIFALSNPFLLQFFDVFCLILDILMFFVFFVVFTKKYIDAIVLPVVFKTLFKPFFWYLVTDTSFVLMEVL